MDDDEISFKEWTAISATEYAKILSKVWSRPFVSLTGAAYWIGSGGQLREPGDGELEGAARALIKKLQSGEIVAFGVPNGGGFHEAIPIEHILSATLDGSPIFIEPALDDSPHILWGIIPGAHRDSIEDRAQVRWRDVSIMRETVIETWPATQDKDIAESVGSTETREDQMLPYKTGAQGRPSPIQLVEREAERRRASGEAVDNLTEEAKSLHVWCKREHPNAPTPTSKTIENRIRHAHRNWKAAK
jgi:hypothetical protein